MPTAPRRLGPVPALLGAAAGRAWRLPPRRNKVLVERALRIPMRDGVELLADHYAPAEPRPGANLAAGPRPTVLMRCPYGRGLQFATLMGQPYAERGYHVVIQSVRGTFGSGGEFHPGRHEAEDGQDTVAWLRRQEWFDGRLATVGASYLGYVQWALALDPPPELKAMVVQIGPHDLAGAGTGHGVYELYNLLMWSELMHSQERYSSVRMIWRTAHAERRLAPALERLPLRATAEHIAAGAPWYDQWLDHPDLADPFWSGYRAAEALDRVTAPVLLISGFHDFFVEQTLAQYRRLTEREVEVGMILGPWTHLSIDPHTALSETLAWLDKHVAGDVEPDTGSEKSVSGVPATCTPVRVWVGGAGDEPGEERPGPDGEHQNRTAKGADVPGRWRALQQWPPAGVSMLGWLLGGGATLTPEPADLAVSAGTAGASSSSSHAGASTFRYDPADPTPSLGGRLMAASGGSTDNAAVEARSDVLTFTGPVLTEPLEVMGAPTVELYLSSDNPYADLFVRLCDVDEQGHSFNLTDQITRLPVGAEAPVSGPVSAPVSSPASAPTSAPTSSGAPGGAVEVVPVRLIAMTLPDIAHRFRRGHRIRLQISGGAHPRYARNMGTAEDPADAVTMVPATHRVHHSPEYASCLNLPVLKATAEDAH